MSRYLGISWQATRGCWQLEDGGQLWLQRLEQLSLRVCVCVLFGCAVSCRFGRVKKTKNNNKKQRLCGSKGVVARPNQEVVKKKKKKKNR